MIGFPWMFATLEGTEVVPTDDATVAGKAFTQAYIEIEGKSPLFVSMIGSDIRVSTVFLFINHGFHGSPLWFETIIFGGPHDQDWMARYATYEEAKKGHQEMVDRVTLEGKAQ